MTTYHETMVTCGRCSHVSSVTMLGSTNEFGSRDLDLRPARMARDTMHLWVQECEYCGYVAADLEDAPRVELPTEWLKEQKESLSDIGDELARRFLVQYAIAVKSKDPRTAFYAALHAAWALDDSGEAEGAVRCRKLALGQFSDMLRHARKSDNRNGLRVQRSDLLRRSGQFDKVIEDYEGVKYSEDILNAVLWFELRKAREQDSGCYNIMQALELYKKETGGAAAEAGNPRRL